MKIYTFFEESIKTHNPDSQERLISLWKDNWIDKGWEPVILNNDFAKAHYYYNEFVEKMSKYHVLITGNKINEYGVYCYTRWLAYAMLDSNDQIYTCDYDLINNGLKPNQIKNSGGLHLMSEYCPCFVSGNSRDFLRLARFMANITEIRYDFLRNNIKNISGMRSNIYHDQDVLVNNISNLYCSFGTSMANDLNFNFSTKNVGQMSSKSIFDDFVFKKKLPKTLHFSRNSMIRFKKQIGDSQIDDDVLRCNIIEEKFR